uniref:Cyclic nucleotide-binding domain-containing protein n=1 Tax=Globisporangium ultimum (strain ATCC 200006 / CBS 805.95 / DAOM BR144) TaxID=431595 RepID=K3WDZ5_GLOUD
MNKLVRIVHLRDLTEKLQHTLVYDLKINLFRPSVLYFTRFTFNFVIGVYWIACFFYGFSFAVFHDGGPASWLMTPGILSFNKCNGLQGVSEIPLHVKYARSFHFSMGAITTVSYGDIAPQNTWETYFGTNVIIMSIVLFRMLSGGFFQLFEVELGKRADYEERVAHVAHYMIFHHFHARIWKQMQVYFASPLARKQRMNEEELLRGLTSSVKHGIMLHANRDFVSQMKLFANCEEAFIRVVVASFQQERFVRHDTIISEGDTGKSLYVIESGLVSVCISKKFLRSNTVARDVERPEFEVIKLNDSTEQRKQFECFCEH